MKKKNYYCIIAAIFASAIFASCGQSELDGLSNNNPFQTTTGSGGDISTIGDLNSFTVELNTSVLSEQDDLPTDESNTLYSHYIETNFTEKYTTTVTFNGTEDATVSGIVNGDSISIDKGYVELYLKSKGTKVIVCGTTSDGSLKVYSDKKFCMVLQNASITSSKGAAINIQNGNCFMVLSGTNTLSDTSTASYTTPNNEDMKAVLFSEDDIRFSGSGTLSVTANNTVSKGCISSDDAVFIRPNTNIQLKAIASAGNGIKANDAIIIKGGVLNIETAGAGSKGLSSDANMQIYGGRTNIITTGGVDTSNSSDPSGCAAIKCDSTLTVYGGELNLKSTGQGGKGISADEAIEISGGTIRIITEGSQYGTSSSQTGPGGNQMGPGNMRMQASTTSSNSVSPKGIRCDKNITISGGNIMVRTSGSNAEGIESKATLTFNGGNTAALAYDDGFNAKTINITGGKALAISYGNCDGMDSNGAITATGGVLIGVASNLNSEDGIDCESGLTIKNATVIGLSTGGMGTRVSGSYVSCNISGVAGDYISLTNGSQPLVTFTLPRTYNSGKLIISAPSMTSGSYNIVSGGTPAGGTVWMNYLEGCTAISGGSQSTVTAR